MQVEFISLKKQIKFACILIIDSFVILIVMFINVSRMPKILEKILFVFVAVPFVAASVFGLMQAIPYFVSDNFIINYMLIFMIFYYISFVCIACQFLIIKLIEKRGKPSKKNKRRR